MIEPNKASEGRALPVGCACYPRHHQALRNRPNITDNSSQEDTKLQVKANAVKARINGKHSANTTCKNNSWQNVNSTCMKAAHYEHQFSFSMHHPLPGNHPMDPHDTPSTTPWSEQQNIVVVSVVIFFFFFSVTQRIFPNLRTACSETLMLRERKASMADRSLSSLTGELLLLVTAAVAFTTFAARRLSGDG